MKRSMAVICDAMDIEEQETYLEPLSNFPESTFSVGRGLLGNLRHIRRKNCQLHLPNNSAKPIVLYLLTNSYCLIVPMRQRALC